MTCRRPASDHFLSLMWRRSEEHPTCFHSRASSDGLRVRGLMLQYEWIKNGTADDTSPPHERARPCIILTISEDFLDHRPLTSPTVHGGACCPSEGRPHNPGSA